MSAGFIKSRNLVNNQWLCGNGSVKGAMNGRPGPTSVYSCITPVVSSQGKAASQCRSLLNTGFMSLMKYTM